MIDTIATFIKFNIAISFGVSAYVMMAGGGV